MSCRQTGERAERLLEWLDQSRLLIRAQSRALRTEVQGIANELLHLIEAVERPATAGLLGTWGSARTDLLGALVTDAAGSTTDDENHLLMGRERLMTLLPRDSDGGVAAGLRLVAAERAESPFRFPIRLTLLSQLDLVKIIASAYLLHVPPSRQARPTPETICQRLTVNAQEVVHQAFSGLSRRDIDTLRDALHAVAPESMALRLLNAGGYWDTLGGLIPHLPEALRRKAFALLWGEDPALTALFDRLSDAIEMLGFTGETFAGLDAFTGRDPATGWMIRHENSVLAITTVLTCHDRPQLTVRISSRHGRSTDVERFVLAALVDEVRLPVAPSSLPLLETADLLVLPAARPVLLWPSASGSEMRARPGYRALSTTEALEIFAAQKAAYLIETAVRRHTMTSLLVAVDLVDRRNGTEMETGSAAAVANWVEITQGETAHVRERRRTGLSILVADRGIATNTVDPVYKVNDGADPRLADTVEAVLDGNTEWAHDWTPNRPFRNVFSWRPPRAAPLSATSAAQSEAASHGSVQHGSADILRFERLRGHESPLGSLTDHVTSYDLVNLMHAMTQSTTGTIHLQQLSARLNELRRALSARFLRLHISNDPAGVVEWRRQICHVARSRLERSGQTGCFGRLQRALMFSESEAVAVLARIKSESVRSSVDRGLDLRALEPARIVEACLEAWVSGMRQIARAPILMRAIQIPAPVFAHIVDELVLGALRIGLQEKLSEAVRRIQLSTSRAVDCEHSIAALMERGINAYVETLDPAARAFRNSVHRDTRFGMGPARGNRADTGRSETAQGGPVAPRRATTPAPSAVADEWTDTFVDLIEANILGAGLLGGAGHLNRELGEVLNTLSSSTFEGFQ